MSISIYQVSAPVLVRFLKNLSAILDKAAAHCDAKKIEPSVIAGYRLAPDMFPLARQIQVMTDLAKGCGGRLAGVDVPPYADTESTIDELKARIAKTVAFLEGLKAEQFEGAESREITLKIGGNDLKFSGADYLTGFVLPNFYFHAATAYAIMRHCGVEIGKRDYLGQI